MVSRYRDIIETSQTNLSKHQASLISTTASNQSSTMNRLGFITIKVSFIGSTENAEVDTTDMHESASASVSINNTEV